MRKLAFFDTKPYDKVWFEKLKTEYEVDFKYYEARKNTSGKTADWPNGSNGYQYEQNE